MLFFFFFNDTATTEIYTLSLHDALPICGRKKRETRASAFCRQDDRWRRHGSCLSEMTLKSAICVPLLKLQFRRTGGDRKSTRLNSSHANISYAVFCLKKKKNTRYNFIHE